MTSTNADTRTTDSTPDHPVEARGSRSLSTLVASAIDQGGLATLSERSDIDSCAVVGEAAPALALGDLSERDAGWVMDHAESCPECTEDLRNAWSLDVALGRIGALIEPLTDRQPPATERRARAVRSRSSDAGLARVWNLETPIGGVYLALSDSGVCEVDFAATMDEPRLFARLRSRGFAPQFIADDQSNGEIDAMASQLSQYFAGRRRRLDLPIDLAGVTPFTRSVLDATATIPFGEVATYHTIASWIGQPTASRAVGNALGRNPVPLIIPCHRVVRSDLSPGGFAGGSAIKRHLLRLEGAPVIGRGS